MTGGEMTRGRNDRIPYALTHYAGFETFHFFENFHVGVYIVFEKLL